MSSSINRFKYNPHTMFSATILTLMFSTAVASPLLESSAGWDTWFGSPSNAADTQVLPQSDSVSIGNDMLYSNDLNSYQFDPGNILSSPVDENVLSGTENPESTVAYSDSWRGKISTNEDSMFGPEAQVTTEFMVDANQDQLAELVQPPAAFNLAAFDLIPKVEVPKPENPCPLIETRCCKRIQYAPLLYVEKEHCEHCKTSYAVCRSICHWSKPPTDDAAKDLNFEKCPKMQIFCCNWVCRFFPLFARLFWSFRCRSVWEKGELTDHWNF